MFSRETLHLIILPTENCNFRCVYCYERFVKGKMSDGVLRAVLLFLNKMSEVYKRIHLSFFGGEPLLAYDVILKVLEHMRGLRERKGIDYDADMTTNGYLLTPERFARLVELGVKGYQITFDGYRDFHDRVRITVGGTKTFDRILNNLREMKRTNYDFNVLLRLHVHRENVESLKRLIDLLSQEFGDDRRFRYFIRSVSRLGGENDEKVDPALDSQVIEVYKYAKSKLRNVSLLTFGRPIGNVGLAYKLACYAANPNSLVIRMDGKVNKCTVYFYDPLNEVGYLDEEGNLHVDGSKLYLWTRGVITGNPEELFCPARGLLRGRR